MPVSRARPPASGASPGAPSSASRAVAEYLERLAAGGASRVLLRQRGWALREAVLFAAAGRAGLVQGHELTADERETARALTPQVTLADLLGDGFAALWLAHADPVLRGRAVPAPPTQRARLASLRALAGFVGAELPGHGTGKPALRAVLERPEVDAALRVLTQRLPGRGPDDHVRLAAVLAVMAARPMRSQDLSALRVEDVHDAGGHLAVRSVDEDVEPIVLRGVAADRLEDWLAVRAGLVGALQGGPVHALWTSIRSNSRPDPAGRSLPLPPGMPLKPRGLQRAYARAVLAANLFHPSTPGFPLPRSLDLLRRSLEALQ